MCLIAKNNKNEGKEQERPKLSRHKLFQMDVYRLLKLGREVGFDIGSSTTELEKVIQAPKWTRAELRKIHALNF